MACEQPQRLLPGAFIQAVAYAGTAVTPDAKGAPYQIDAQDIRGPLDRQIAGACDFVSKNMLVAAHKRPQGGREDLPQYDLLAVFEAVTNAVAHRDYSMAGSKVRLRLFADRLELFSPGMLVNTMTPASLPFRQAARTEALTSLLARCQVPDTRSAPHRARIMDKRGEGVPIILARSTALSGKAPSYRLIDESELLLIIHAADPAADADGAPLSLLVIASLTGWGLGRSGSRFCRPLSRRNRSTNRAARGANLVHAAATHLASRQDPHRRLSAAGRGLRIPRLSF